MLAPWCSGTAGGPCAFPAACPGRSAPSPDVRHRPAATPAQGLGAQPWLWPPPSRGRHRAGGNEAQGEPQVPASTPSSLLCSPAPLLLLLTLQLLSSWHHHSALRPPHQTGLIRGTSLSFLPPPPLESKASPDPEDWFLPLAGWAVTIGHRLWVPSRRALDLVILRRPCSLRLPRPRPHTQAGSSSAPGLVWPGLCHLYQVSSRVLRPAWEPSWGRL